MLFRVSRNSLVFFMVVIVFFALSVAACGGEPTTEPGPTTTPAPTVIPTPTPPPPPPDVILQRAFAALARANSFQIDMESRGVVAQEGISLDVRSAFSGDFQHPDRMRWEGSVVFPDNSVELELVAIGSQTYIRNSSTTQWEVITDPGSAFVGPTSLVAITDRSLLEDSVLVGETSLEGVPVYRVRAVVFSSTPAQEVEYWIGIEDFLVRQFSTRPETAVDAGNDVLENRARLSDFGKPVDIQAPAITAP